MGKWQQFKKAEGETIARAKGIMNEHPKDICECGDYRKDHPDNGACNLNGLGHNIPDYKCERFRLAVRDEQPAESEGR